jgi:hypothetical protein
MASLSAAHAPIGERGGFYFLPGACTLRRPVLATLPELWQNFRQIFVDNADKLGL